MYGLPKIDSCLTLVESILIVKRVCEPIVQMQKLEQCCLTYHPEGLAVFGFALKVANA
jgi:hypothetical protein